MNTGSVLFGIFVCSVLLVISVFDIRKKIIPDVLLIILVIGTVLYEVLTAETDVINRLILSFSVFIVLFIIRYTTHGLGFGDVKLCGIISYIGGFWVFVISLLTACILGICTFCVFRLLKRDIRRIPFAPFVSAGFLAGKVFERFLL